MLLHLMRNVEGVPHRGQGLVHGGPNILSGFAHGSSYFMNRLRDGIGGGTDRADNLRFQRFQFFRQRGPRLAHLLLD
jgi:hypothetical protein